MKSSPVEVSFDSSVLLDEYPLCTQDLLDFPESSPCKKAGNAFDSFESLSALNTPDLLYKSISSELFQVTNHLRRSGGADDGLGHDKIDKLVEQLQATDADLELDAQLRTRVFKNRFRKADPLDMLLDAYLRTEPKKDKGSNRGCRNPRCIARGSENCRCGENTESGKDSKGKSKGKSSNSNNANNNSCSNINNINNTTYFDKENAPRAQKADAEPPRKRLKTAIPVLQALPTNTRLRTSPRRVCVPRRQQPGAPARKPLQRLDIFLVDALTGRMGDATQFGTELNASNCEGFPMPEDTNEIVQIPTNDAGAGLKMALIKAFHSLGVGKVPAVGGGGDSVASGGFYSKQEFDEYRSGKPHVRVFAEKRHVRWADELEW